MQTKEQLRQNSWSKQQSAKALADNKKWDDAAYLIGFAVEIMLKARICVDHKLPGFPETPAEFKAIKSRTGLELREHDFEELLNMTTLTSHVKRGCLKEWGTCLQWSTDARYQMGKANEISANELIRSAVVVLRRISELPGLQGYDIGSLSDSDNPYLRLIAVEQELSDEHGDFVFFGIWHRTNSFPRSADVVVAAPWIDENSRKGVDFVVDAIQKTLVGEEINRIAGVMALDIHNPIIRQLTTIYGTKHSWAEFMRCQFNGLELDHAIFITSQMV